MPVTPASHSTSPLAPSLDAFAWAGPPAVKVKGKTEPVKTFVPSRK